MDEHRGSVPVSEINDQVTEVYKELLEIEGNDIETNLDFYKAVQLKRIADILERIENGRTQVNVRVWH
jgi:hypothetical protein